MRHTRLAEFIALALLIAAALVPMIPQVIHYDDALAVEETWSPVVEAGAATTMVCTFS